MHNVAVHPQLQRVSKISLSELSTLAYASKKGYWAVQNVFLKRFFHVCMVLCSNKNKA